MQSLESKPITDVLDAAYAAEIEQLQAQGVNPKYVTLMSRGSSDKEDEMSTYVDLMGKYFGSINLTYYNMRLPTSVMHIAVDHINEEPDIHGGAVVLPVYYPDLDSSNRGRLFRRQRMSKLLDPLHPIKDVDAQGAFSSYDVGATADAAGSLLSEYGFDGTDAHVVIFGSKGKVGSHIHDIFGSRNVRDLTGIDRHNLRDAQRIAKDGDILIAATGNCNTITPDMLRKDQVIVGIGATDLHEDVYDPEHRLRAITPRRGGVGRLTLRKIAGRVINAATELAA